MKKIITNLKHFLRLSYCYLMTRILFIFNKPPKVLNSLESLKQINKNKLSVTRFGDGEFMIIEGKSIKFQEYDMNLAKRLSEIVISDDNKIAVCIPAIYDYSITRSLKYNEEIFWLNQILDYKKRYLNTQYLNKTYYDACITRPYIRYKEYDVSVQLFNELNKIWKKQDLLIVEGKYSRLGVGNNLFANAKSVKRILCPNKNAYQHYDEILKQTIKYSKGKLVLIALGPTATVLAYDLANKNIRAIDLGHLDLEYEWFLKNSDDRVLVKNKIVNELEEESELSEINDNEYLESIVYEIK